MERRAQERAGSPLERRDDFFVVIEAGGVFHRDESFGAEIFRQAGPEGSGPPPHSHPWDEAFYVIAGQVSFGVDGDDTLLAPPGTLAHFPAGSVHWFRFGPGGGEMISMTSRPGAAAFFADVDREISPAEPDFGVLLAVASSHGLTVALPAS